METKQDIPIIQEISKLLLCFIAAGFVGWCYETILTSIAMGEFVNRGVLPVPLLPIYGFFSIILAGIFHKPTKVWKVFVLSTIGTTVFEYIAAIITERIFGYMLWDYFSWKFNFQGRISLFSSLIFGALSVLFVSVVKPLSEKLHEKFPKAAPICVFVLAAVNIIICVLINNIVIH